MKEAKEFLKSALRKLFLELDNVEISYEYRISSNTHIVEVKPNSVFRNCETYIEKEIELENAFYNNFPDESILFISEESLTQIKSPDLVLRYKLKYNISNFFTPILSNIPLAKNQVAKMGKNNYALAA